MKKIPLTQGQFALVDDKDYKKLINYKWCALRIKSRFYAVRRPSVNEKGTILHMHRVIMNLSYKDGKLVDHKNRNSLDNQRKNLRITTYSINAINSKIPCSNTSGYRGVVLHRRSKKWQAQIVVRGKAIYCGSFDDPVSAAMAFDTAAIRFRGKDAILNFPMEANR